MSSDKPKLSLADLAYGFLNPVTDPTTGNTASRRRSSSIDFIQNSIQDLYASHALRGVETFKGVVVFVGEKQVGLGGQKDKLLEMYAARGPGQSLVDLFSGDKVELVPVYKVYIPELEFRPAPLSFDDPVVLTYFDVYSEVGGLWEADPELGSLVEVRFSNLNNFAGATIISVGNSIAFADFEGGNNQADHAHGTSRPAGSQAETDASSPGITTGGGPDKSCPSTTRGSGGTAGIYTINGSDHQMGKQLHQNDWLADQPENPVIPWLPPLKPSEAREGGPGTRLRASSGFARGSGAIHGALDLSAVVGTPLYAVQDGIVVQSPTTLCRAGGKPSTAGNMFQYKTTEGYYVLYIHMDMPSKFRRGASITKGQIVGYVGNTGATQVAHLHWAVGSSPIASGNPGRLHPADFYPPEWFWGNWGAKPAVQSSRRGGKAKYTPRKV